jgi:3-methyladenine DNA glycosylase AlkD
MPPDALVATMRAACDATRSKSLASYFGTSATSPYVGLTAVAARRVAYNHVDAFSPSRACDLLASDLYEPRFVALEILVRFYEIGGAAEKQRVARLYLRNLALVDHWVLVDASAPYVLGDYLRTRSRSILFELARSASPAKRRIAMVATWAFIKAGDFEDTLRIAELLLHDDDPLIHRAVGWMLREIGKRSQATEMRFLDAHRPEMPRLMLRSAVDQLPESLKRSILKAPRRAALRTGRR